MAIYILVACHFPNFGAFMLHRGVSPEELLVSFQ